MNVHDQLKQMTLEEKLAQMTQIPPHFFNELSKTEVFGERRNIRFSRENMMSIGSILGVHSAEEMIQIQSMILEESRLKIPALFMADVVHGYQTIFPIPLAQAGSFNDALMKQSARIAAVEASTAGIHITFAPMVDMARDARWGRVMEGYGEDPYLGSRMAVAAVQGFQNGDPKSLTYVGACFKHFAGYGASEAGRDYNTVDMSYERFYNLYAKPYEAAVEAGADMTMLAFNTWNGIPSTIHRDLIRTILIESMGFEGVVISDYDALAQTIAHGASRDAAHACEQGLNAGLMIEMGTNTFIHHGKACVERGVVSIEMIDEAVLKILTLKEKLGLFENPFKGASSERAATLVKHLDHMNLALKAAEESIVLLKNEGILPLQKPRVIGLSGLFKDTRSMLGAWHWHGQTQDILTYAEVCHALGYHTVLLDETDSASLASVDVVLHMTGEVDRDTGESRSKVIIVCPPSDQAWIKTVHAAGKRIVSVVHSGRPLVIEPLMASDAIVYAWYLGSKHTQAVLNILLGKAQPTAKLPMLIPRHVGQYPMSYHDFTTGRPFNPQHPEYTTKYIDIDLKPQYPFGYGLTYEALVFRADVPLKVSVHEETFTVDVWLENPHAKAVTDVMQLYYRLHPSQPVMGEKRLIRYDKVTLEASESRLLQWTLSPHELMPVDEHKHTHPCSGTLTLWLGFSMHTLQPFTIEWSQPSC